MFTYKVQYFVLQLFIDAFDDGVPNVFITTSLTININRNLSPPVFQPSSYTATINDYDAPGTSVIPVSARDTDPQVSMVASAYCFNFFPYQEGIM